MTAFSRFIPVVLLLGIGTAIYADTASPSETTTKSPPEKQLSPTEIKARAEEVVGQLDTDYQSVLRLQAVAKKKADVIKLTCVNDRLVELKAEMNIGNTAATSIKGSDDPATLQSLHHDIEDVSSSSKKLLEEAKTCIGETELYKQESGVDVTHPPFTDDPGTTDPTGPLDNGVDVEPPGYASPFS